MSSRMMPYFFSVLLVLLLCGCRVRTTAVLPDGRAAFPQSEESGHGAGTDGSGLSEDLLSEESPEKPAGNEVSGGQTVEDPDAERKEFDENADVEIVSGTERKIYGEGEGNGLFETDGEPILRSAKLSDAADQTASRKVRVDEADKTGVSEDADKAESSLQYYTVLLQDRAGSMYECKRSYVYWETLQDHVTIYRKSPEHQMILDAGAYDVSARLTEERLRIDDGWVVRKNPGVIVKIVPGDILGSSVRSGFAAESRIRELTAREGWAGIDAVRQNRVLLISEEMFAEPYLQVGAALAIAKTAAPELFADVDLQDALTALISEATGEAPEGKYFYPE